MRYALLGSALVHVVALGAALLALNWPAPDDAPSAQSITVDIISMVSVSSNQTSAIQSDASENLVSSGAKAVAPAPPQTVEPVKSDTAQPVQTAVQPTGSAPINPLQAKPLEPVTTATISPVAADASTPIKPALVAMSLLSAATTQQLQAEAVTLSTPAHSSPKPIEAVQSAAAQPVQPIVAPALQPAQTMDQKVAPVPQVLTRPRPPELTKVAEQTPRPSMPKPPAPTTPRPAAPAGNGGHNQADSAASKPSGGQQTNSGSGGDAAVARYPSQVVGKLRRALRYPSGAHGASGDVQVQFVVSASGQATGVRLLQSSGNAAIDQAALDTVRRAAPFPPIPASANRNEWAFTVPLGFVRS